MTALPETPEAAADCQIVADDFARRLPGLDLGFLRMMLQFMQHRLGTSAEQPCDLERVQALGHEINNRLTALKMETDLRRLEASSENQPS
jgi:hypothetical protein